jgi:hypothetical protein
MALRSAVPLGALLRVCPSRSPLAEVPRLVQALSNPLCSSNHVLGFSRNRLHPVSCSLVAEGGLVSTYSRNLMHRHLYRPEIGGRAQAERSQTAWPMAKRSTVPRRTCSGTPFRQLRCCCFMLRTLGVFGAFNA